MTQSSASKHEALCRRCGECCYEKLIIDDHVFTLRTPCCHLDESAMECRIYPRRHKINQRCLTVVDGIEFGVFPADCPYVANLENYKPAEDGRLDEQLVRMIERGQLCTGVDILAEMRRRRDGANTK